MMKFIDSFIYSKQIGYRLSRHILFWLTDSALYLLVASATNKITGTEILNLALKVPLAVLATYFILYYLIPTYSNKSNKGQLLAWIIALLIFIGIGMRYYRLFILNPFLYPDQPLSDSMWSLGRIVGEIFSWMAVIAMAIAIKLMKNKSELQKTNEQLTEEKKIAELNFLKSQMHPHFLFNTLNTLYSETIQESGKAQQVVLHLANLLRFILDECSKPLIPIGHELKVIRDFIALEALRHGERLSVNLVVENINHNIHISPLILLPFVENSFKHTLNEVAGKIEIEIIIRMQHDKLIMTVENDMPIIKQNPGTIPGKGIPNVTRQLELLYGRDYSLQLNSDKEKYRVSLEVPAKNQKAYA
jgi:two-component system, LytTR family, sensor kinase